MSEIRDEDGVKLRDGDYITFSFGIPPTSCLCRINHDGKEWIMTVIDPPDINPKQEKLAKMMKWYPIWKASKERVAAATKNFARDS